MNRMIARGIFETADSLGMDPVDLATIISYETGGTFDPAKRGPTTQWGQHRGLIQFGEPQAQQYGVNWSDPVASQLGANGAVAKYFRASGWKPGMNMLDAYSIVNAGAPGRHNATDANNGGAPGTVRDKVEQQMGGHRQNAANLFSSGMAIANNAPSLSEFVAAKRKARKEGWSNQTEYKQQAQAGTNPGTPSLSEFVAAKRKERTDKKQQQAEPSFPLNISNMDGKQLLQAFPAIAGDVPPVPGSQEDQARARYSELSKQPQKTISDMALGAGEAGLSTLTGMTSGTVGMLAGSLKGIYDSVAAGNFGTQKGGESAANTANDWASALTYAPRTMAGQEYAQNVADTMSPLQAIAPLSQMQTIGAASRSASLPRTAARATEKSTVSTAAADVANAKNYNIPVMTSDINAPNTWGGRMTQAVGERIPMFGTGGQRAAQQAARSGAVQNFMRNYGADGNPVINDVTANLLQKRSEDLGRYSGMKSDVINRQAGNVVPTQATIAAIDAQISTLKGMKTKAVEPLIAKLEDYRQAFSNQDLPAIELLRKQLGDELQSPDMATVKTAAGKAATAVYSGVKQDMGDYIKGAGHRRDYDKWTVANARLSEMIGETANSGLKSVLRKGAVTPEITKGLLFSKKPSDVELLRKSLTPDGRNYAKSAIMQDVYSKIGNEANPERFATQIGRLAPQTKVMFSKPEVAVLSGLVDAINLTKRAGIANTKPVTGAEMTGFATPAIATYMTGGSPVAGLAATAGGGLLAQAYESPVIRDLMIRLGRTTDRKEKHRIYDSSLFVANNPEITTGSLGIDSSRKQGGVLTGLLREYGVESQ